MDNIFDKACLIQLSARLWQGLKMIDPSVMAQLGNSDWVKGRKHLVDPEHLAPIKACVSRARCLLKKQALPFPLDGLTLVPKDAISGIELGLQDVQREFWQSVLGFVDYYPRIREEAQQGLGELFDETDYPMSVRDRFNFEWRYVQLALPGRSRLLSPEIYERERRKFVDLMEATRAEATLALRAEFSGLVGHLAERLSVNGSDRPKVLRSSMVEKLSDFLDSFGNRNLFQDEQLADLVNLARGMIHGVDGDALRNNESLRQRVGLQMQTVKDAIDAAIENLPRRRVLMAA